MVVRVVLAASYCGLAGGKHEEAKLSKLVVVWPVLPRFCDLREASLHHEEELP